MSATYLRLRQRRSPDCGPTRRNIALRFHLGVELLEDRIVPSLMWTSYGESSVTQAASSDTVQVGVAGRAETDQQANAFHGSSAALIAAKQYQVTFDYDISTWDSYNASFGYWDSFSVSVTSVPYPQVQFLMDPLNLPFVTGGAEYGGHVLQHYTGTQTITVSFNASSVHYLNCVLDTSTQPQGDTLFPSWGTFKVDAVRAVAGVQQASYSGDHEFDARPDDGGAAYTGPQYLDQNANGNITEAGDYSYPVVYSAGGTMTIGAQFLVGDLANPSGGVMVEGTGPDGINVPATAATLAGNTVSLPPTQASTAFANSVNKYQSFVMTWSVSFDGGSTWLKAGKSHNTVYVTLKDPLNPGGLFETVLDLGSRAQGDTTDAATVKDIWAGFTTLNVVRHDGVTMTYWAKPETTCQTAISMLSSSDGDGTCIAWSQLLQMTIQAEGITGTNIDEIKADTTVNPGADGFLVKNWNFGKTVNTGPDGICDTKAQGDDYQLVPVGAKVKPNQPCVTPGPDGTLNTTPANDDQLQDGLFPGTAYPYVIYDATNAPYGDVAKQPGIPGQGGVANPPPSFFNHFVMLYNGQVYDPSYGAGPFNSTLAHQDAAIDGIESGSRAKPNHTTSLDLTYTPI